MTYFDEFNNKVFIITGASRGIGEAVAKSLMSYKCKVIWVARHEIDPFYIKDINSQSASTNYFFNLDVSDPSAVEQLFIRISEITKEVHVLINAAAILGPSGLFCDNDPFQWFETFKINVFGTFNMMKFVIPLMSSGQGGSIINFSGGGAASPSPDFSAYGASKAAIVRLTETTAAEISNRNIRINVIAPGANKTRMLDQFINSGGKPQTVVTIDKPVELVHFLSSTISNHISGKFIHVLDDYRSFSEDINHKSIYTLRRIEE